jgi:hypothetical protein
MAAVATNTFSGDLFSASDTVSGIPIGAAFPGRVVVIGVIGSNTGSVTINGIVASAVDPSNVGFASAVVPTGTTATIVVAGPGPTEVFGAWSLAGFPVTAARDGGFITDGGGGIAIEADDNGCVVGWTIGVSDPPGTVGTFTATITNDGAAFNTDAAGVFGNRPARVGSGNLGPGGGGSLTVHVGGFSGFWYLAAASYGGNGPPPPDTSLVGPIWVETRCG